MDIDIYNKTSYAVSITRAHVYLLLLPGLKRHTQGHDKIQLAHDIQHRFNVNKINCENCKIPFPFL